MIIDNKIQWVVKATTWQIQVNENLTKLTLVIEEQKSEYPSSIWIDFFNEKANQASRIEVWQEVSVWVNFKCREYNGKYYTNISWWNFKILSNEKKQEEEDEVFDLPF